MRGENSLKRHGLGWILGILHSALDTLMQPALIRRFVQDDKKVGAGNEEDCTLSNKKITAFQDDKRERVAVCGIRQPYE